jgi:hypothetical protein
VIGFKKIERGAKQVSTTLITVSRMLSDARKFSTATRDNIIFPDQKNFDCVILLTQKFRMGLMKTTIESDLRAVNPRGTYGRTNYGTDGRVAQND